jgi:hypothetical protein
VRPLWIEESQRHGFFRTMIPCTQRHIDQGMPIIFIRRLGCG